MQKAINVVAENFNTMRTGRANPAILDKIVVSCAASKGNTSQLTHSKWQRAQQVAAAYQIASTAEPLGLYWVHSKMPMTLLAPSAGCPHSFSICACAATCLITSLITPCNPGGLLRRANAPQVPCLHLRARRQHSDRVAV